MTPWHFKKAVTGENAKIIDPHEAYQHSPVFSAWQYFRKIEGPFFHRNFHLLGK